MTETASSKNFLNSLALEVERVVLATLNYLERQFTDCFIERSFYAESFTAASLAYLGIKKDFQEKLIEAFFENREATSHPEFNLYAWQEFLRYKNDARVKKFVQSTGFKQLFLRKRSNWVLLRSLVRIRSSNVIKRRIGMSQSLLILTINRWGGYITDNTLRAFYTKKRSVSSQYHAFATMLLGEIAQELSSLYFQRQFLKNLETSRREIQNDGEFKMTGRGQKQIFGYAALLYSLAMAHRITQEKKYVTDFTKVFSYLTPFQKESGVLPIIVTHSDPRPYLYSYNNRLDYLAFIAFCLAKSLTLLKRVS